MPWLPSTDFSEGLPAGWTIDSGGSFGGTPVVAPGTITYDYAAVTVLNTCGEVYSGDGSDTTGNADGNYHLKIPYGNGEAKFTITISGLGARESVSFRWYVGGVTGKIVVRSDYHGVDPDSSTGAQTYQALHGAEYAWTGSCTYRIWYPDGANEYEGQYPRCDFDQGSFDIGDSWPQPSPGNIKFESGPVLTGRDFNYPFFGPWDPITGQIVVSGISIVSWDPDGPAFKYYDGWFYLAQEGEWTPRRLRVGTDGEWRGYTSPMRL